MAAVAVWWTRGGGTVRVKRAHSPRVKCAACNARLRVPQVHEGDTLECQLCGETIVIGERRHGSRKRRSPDPGAFVRRPFAPLGAAQRIALLALFVALLGWYAVDPEPFHVAAASIADGAVDGWRRLRAWFGRPA